MKTYKGMAWAEFIGFIGNAVKDELIRQSALKDGGFVSIQTGYGKFGSVESNYTLKKGNGLADKLSGEKVFTIHDNSAEGITPRVILHDPGYFGQKAAAIFKTMGKNLGMDFKVEYA